MKLNQLIKLSQMYDIDMFVDIQLPENIDKEILLNDLIMNFGWLNTISTNPEEFKTYIDNFYKLHYNEFKNMVNALLEDYNPIHNYDRYEEYDENFDKSGNNETVNSNSSNNTTKNDVSAYDSNGYTPQNQQTDSLSENFNENSNMNENTKHTSKNHLFGNIGVTTSQQMLESEIDLRKKYNIYQIINRIFADELLLRV